MVKKPNESPAVTASYLNLGDDIYIFHRLIINSQKMGIFNDDKISMIFFKLVGYQICVNKLQIHNSIFSNFGGYISHLLFLNP